MAIVNLKNVKVYATFSKGFRVVEESTGRDGQTFKTRWTVWADAMESAKIREGDVVSVSGFHGAHVKDWTDKDGGEHHSVELSVNSPHIEHEAAEPTQADYEWDMTGPVVDETPVPF